MDFKNASLDELKQFVKEHKIKGVSALRKSALIEFLEKNYNGETDHTAEINEAKPQKADAEKKKRPGKTQKKGKTEHTDKSASSDQTVQVKNAEATEQQEKSEADVVKKPDRNKSENSQKSGEDSTEIMPDDRPIGTVKGRNVIIGHREIITEIIIRIVQVIYQIRITQEKTLIRRTSRL